jgi:hypothetical protein
MITLFPSQGDFCATADNGIHGNIPIVIFRIRDKQNENGPDFRMILSQPAQQREEEEPPMQEEEDDIPF